jgi:hypothetical protein
MDALLSLEQYCLPVCYIKHTDFVHYQNFSEHFWYFMEFF